MSGTKVTTDPEGINNPKIENPGIVTSDSLAAESAKQGGDFAADNDSRGVLDQPSSGTTANTTDHSSATTLDAATSRAERTDSADDKVSLGGTGSSGSASNTGGSSTTRVTRSQAAAAAAVSSEDTVPESRPKGSGLKEGGEITGDEPNASFRTDIGSKNDPGRVALEKMEADNANASEGLGGRKYDLDTNTQYDALGGSTAS